MAPSGNGSSINVVTEHMQGLDIDDYADASMDMLEMIFDGIEFFIDEYIYINGKEGIVIAYTSAFPGVTVTFQFLVSVDGMAYIITYTQIGDIDYLLDVLEMLDTFTVS